MKVGIIGSGGREHALCHSIKKSDKIDKIFCFPGNAGTENIAENINLDLIKPDKFYKTIEKTRFVDQISNYKLFGSYILPEKNNNFFIPNPSDHSFETLNNFRGFSSASSFGYSGFSVCHV